MGLTLAVLILAVSILTMQIMASRREAQRFKEYQRTLQVWKDVNDAYTRAFDAAQDAVNVVLDSSDIVIPGHSRVYIKYNRDAHDGATEPLPELLHDVQASDVQRDAGQSSDSAKHSSEQP